MTESEENRLQRMGLSGLGRKDSFIDHEEEWEDKKQLYEFLMGDKSMLVTKPEVSSAGNEPFEVAENPGDKDYVPCHLPIQVMFISATYKKGHLHNIPM